MRRIRAVIGAGYGDEGKGLITDYLSANQKTLVVRFNGGCQAGHTVVLPNGTRHVHHHFGSGILNGSPTFLSNFFVSNPMFFNTEREELHKKGFNPVTFLDPHGLMATPFDVWINQKAEESRGQNRHGSCGMGLGETMHRSKNGFPIEAYYIGTDRDEICDKLEEIEKGWVPKRLDELKIKADVNELTKWGVFSKYLEDCEDMWKATEFVNWKDIAELWKDNDIVFEGAQGLLLDQYHRNFPHVTYAHTGLTNVMDMVKQAGIPAIEVYYVSRVYATRHGRGPLLHEVKDPKEIAPRISDDTNVPNDFQEHLRFGFLDEGTLVNEILKDTIIARSEHIDLKTNFVLTCTDQTAGLIDFYPETGKDRITLETGEFAKRVALRIRASRNFVSDGRTRGDIHANY